MFTIHFLLFKYMPNSTHSFSEVGLANTKHAQACTANADKVTEIMGVHGYMTSHAHKKNILIEGHLAMYVQVIMCCPDTHYADSQVL